MAVVAPMPNASVMMAVSVNAAFFRSVLSANPTSLVNDITTGTRGLGDKGTRD
jgi:hypothetical protein